MAGLAVAAQRTVDVDGDMADLTGSAILADQRPAVDDHTAADPGRDRHVDHVVGALRRAVAPLAHDGGVRVTLQVGGQSHGLLHARCERDVTPAREVGRCDHDPLPRIERTRRRDADPDGIRQAGALRVLAHGECGGADPIDHGLYPLLVTSLHGTTARDDKVGADMRGADLGSAEVDRQDRPVGYLFHRPSL
jgi:hypothetical protein